MKPTKSDAIELLDMIEEYVDEEPVEIIKLITGTLQVAYHQGVYDTLQKFVK